MVTGPFRWVGVGRANGVETVRWRSDVLNVFHRRDVDAFWVLSLIATGVPADPTGTGTDAPGPMWYICPVDWSYHHVETEGIGQCRRVAVHVRVEVASSRELMGSALMKRPALGS